MFLTSKDLERSLLNWEFEQSVKPDFGKHCLVNVQGWWYPGIIINKVDWHMDNPRWEVLYHRWINRPMRKCWAKQETIHIFPKVAPFIGANL